MVEQLVRADQLDEQGESEKAHLIRLTVAARDDDEAYWRLIEAAGLHDMGSAIKVSDIPHHLFAADCADRVLLIFEAADDNRPRKAIEAARSAEAAAWSAAKAAAIAARSAAIAAEAASANDESELRWQRIRLMEYRLGMVS